MDANMFTSVSQRSASAYQRVHVETAVSQANPHQLVSMLFDGYLQAVSLASAAIKQGNVALKGEQIGKAIRIIDEGLKPALNMEQGGDLALNLKGLYGYCVVLLTQANLNNDDNALADATRIMQPVAQGWKEMGAKVAQQ
jgi:flagellar protein FliS